MTRLFLDSNVVVYGLDSRDPAKQDRCLAWLSLAARKDSLTISPQVCAETRSVAERKLKIKPAIVRAAVLKLLPWCTAPMTADEIRVAFDLVDARRMSWWDALILASAISAKCTHVITEDGQSASVIEGVRFIDPFKTAPEDILGAR